MDDIECDDANRKFFDNYNVGTGNRGGNNRVSGMLPNSALQPGVTIEEAYEMPPSNNAQYDGPANMMQLSQLKHGSIPGIEIGTRITIGW